MDLSEVENWCIRLRIKVKSEFDDFVTKKGREQSGSGNKVGRGADCFR